MKFETVSMKTYEEAVLDLGTYARILWLNKVSAENMKNVTI